MENAPEKLQEAYQRIEAGDLPAARTLLEGIQADNENNPDFWWVYAHAVEDPDEGQAALQRVLELDPEYPGAGALAQQTGLGATPAAPPPPTFSPEPAAQGDFDEFSEFADDDFASDFAGAPQPTPATTQPPPPRRRFNPFFVVSAVILLVLLAALILLPLLMQDGTPGEPTAVAGQDTPQPVLTNPALQTTSQAALTDEATDEPALTQEATEDVVVTDEATDEVLTEEVVVTEAMTDDDAATEESTAEAAATDEATDAPEKTETAAVSPAETEDEPTEAPTRAATATPEPTEDPLTQLAADLEIYSVPEDGLETTDTSLGTTFLVTTCAAPGPAASEAIQGIVDVLAETVDELPEDIEAVAFGIDDCEADTTLRVVGVSLQTLQDFAAGTLSQEEFQRQLQPID